VDDGVVVGVGVAAVRMRRIAGRRNLGMQFMVLVPGFG